MSAILSLLRVMTLRDAEAIILEAGKIPSLRRRGQLEPLAMPPLDAQMLAEFTAPLAVSGSGAVAYEDPQGVHYQVSVERGGQRLVVKPGRAAPATPPPAPPTAPVRTAPPIAHETTSPDALARLARLLAPIIAIARDRGASDAIVSTEGSRLRIDGRLDALDVALDDAELAACIAAVGTDTDHGLEIDGVRLRVNAFDHLGGVGLAARLIRDRVPPIAELGLPPEVGNVIDPRDGLVLVCGPTGSGKSTTLAALIDALDQRRAAHVITLEDPIEYRFAARRCLIHQREVGQHVASFAAGLRSALREAPDVIMLGELRDSGTIAAALTAAETGHLVLATLHAPNAAGAIDRMIDAFPENQQRQVRWQLAGVLRTVITQFLLPRKDGGRVAAVELVPLTTAVANLIRKGDLQVLPSTIQTGRDAGMIPLERSLARILESGVCSPQAVKKVAADHDLLAALSGVRLK